MVVRRVFVGLVVVFGGAAAALAVSPVAVSPGSATGNSIDDACPTFSWGSVPGAESYELVVYSAEVEKDAPPELSQRIAGSASTWTPSLDLCLERGGRYAWSVRALGTKEPAGWSAPNFFEVVAGPSRAEFEKALSVVREYLALHDAEAARAKATVRREFPQSAISAPFDPSPSGTKFPVPALVLDGAVGIGASSPQADLQVVATDPAQPAGRIVVSPAVPGGVAGPNGAASVILSDNPNFVASKGFSMTLDPLASSGFEGLTFWETTGAFPLRAKINLPPGEGSGILFLEPIIPRRGISGFSPGPHTLDTTCDGQPCDGANLSNVDAVALGGLPAATFVHPTTTKGELLVHNGMSEVALPVGTDGQVLVSDSTSSEGVAWTSDCDTLQEAKQSICALHRALAITPWPRFCPR